MKKILSLLMAAMMMASVLAGCGSKEETPAESAPEGETPVESTGEATGSGVELKFSTGGEQGTYYGFGNVLAQAITSAGTGTKVTAVTSNGSQDNIEQMEMNTRQLGFVQSDVMSYAYEGTNLFEGMPITGFSTVAALYMEQVQIVTCDPEIKTVADLKGKTVSVGDAGSGVEFNATQILAAYGIDINSDIKKVNASFGDSADSIKDGKIDAAFVTAGAPTTAVVDLATTKDIVVIPIDDEHAAQLMKDYPFYTKNTIPAGTYNGQDEDVATVAVQATLIASNDVSEDAIYELTKALFDNLDELKTGHPKFGELTLENAIAGASVKLHPGAAKYYTEQGLDVSKIS